MELQTDNLSEEEIEIIERKRGRKNTKSVYFQIKEDYMDL